MPDTPAPPTLIVDPQRAYREWLISEIYTANGTGRYVPNVNDSVWDWTQGKFRVVAVDYSTGLSTLSKWIPPKDPNALTDLDLLLGAGPGYQSESYRVYLDETVMPHTLAIDSRMHIYSSTAAWVKIFLGTDISTNGEIISAFYDQSGTFVGENIPLELVVMPDVNNIAVKAPMVGYTVRELPDGEVVTVVVYSDNGAAVSQAKMLIKNTGFVRSTNAALKTIVGISIETPFLSASDPKLIEYPINMPVTNLNMMGVVNYSDGSKLRMPIDGTKFSMYGLENYIATIQGQQVDLVLSYKLSPGELSYVLTPSINKHISVPYKATTMQADGAYTVKLFAYPVWQDLITGYRLEYFLYNLERQQVYPVTNLVEMATGSRAFDGIEYAAVQNIAVAIDLNRVDPQFAAYRHVQAFAITLVSVGTNHNSDAWHIGFEPGQTPPYGMGLSAQVEFVNVNNWKVDISCGLATQAEWLEKVYYATKPLVDPQTEDVAPEPNYFVLVSGNYRVECPIAAWNTIITSQEAPDDGGVIYIEWLRRSSSDDLQLGVSGLVVHYPDTV